MALTVETYLGNAKWVKRIDDYFDDTDSDKNGFLTREEWVKPMKALKDIVPDRTEKIDEVLAAVEKLLDVLGLTEDMKADKQKLKELVAALAISEVEKLNKGELTYTEKLSHALFDVMDRDGNGYLSYDEYKTVMCAAYNETVEECEAVFRMLDKDKNGKIDKNEFAIADAKFWYVLDDDSTDNLYGN